MDEKKFLSIASDLKIIYIGSEKLILLQKLAFLAKNSGNFAIFNRFYNEINKFLILSAKLMQGFKG